MSQDLTKRVAELREALVHLYSDLYILSARHEALQSKAGMLETQLHTLEAMMPKEEARAA